LGKQEFLKGICGIGEKTMLSNLIDYIPLLITLITIITGFITWGLNERSKRKQEGYKRKEEHYTELIKSLKGFYVNSNNKDLKEVFLEQVNLCWMYCPDDVVIKIYDFLEAVNTNSNATDEQKDKALGEVMVAIRNDLLKDTKLKNKLTYHNFRIYSAN
jgi:Pyruvate/2-oxoacid:ferredoxin oxidoreductase delta subunit